MPEPRKRSRSKKRRQKKTPGGKNVTHYKRKRKGEHICAICGKPLRGTPKEEGNVTKSSRRPDRPYGGYLCQECLQNELSLEIMRRFPPEEEITSGEEA
ncbi:MAG: 50S ribosomal protein L34e [Candidatus Korarchaeota archaeon]|nr:50S ribosomal protein L34e [Candidatus Korarchaeota archaeon]NIU82711.1 50S ribosomal protein L34e [Candidatus Thorarchaeota archaeon]NIW13202.1 50S ribosomal protein L34e [Candidatus Thorarchaeota archaeon]NIW51341.1 50S ribosomal protein L34e [Candidatus Korarchaeota archaeon]